MTGPFALDSVEVRQPMQGFRGRFVHTERMTLAYWKVEAGSVLPQHDHPHEQVVNQLAGELELTVGGVTRVLRPGDVWVIPSGVPHSGRAITACEVLDVFQPVREDFR